MRKTETAQPAKTGLPRLTWYPAPPPYDPPQNLMPPNYPGSPIYDRPNTRKHREILEAGYREDVWQLSKLARASLCFRDERLLIDMTLDRIGDHYDQCQVLEQLAGNCRLTQQGRDYLWNSLVRLNPNYHRRVAYALHWNYPS